MYNRVSVCINDCAKRRNEASTDIFYRMFEYIFHNFYNISPVINLNYREINAMPDISNSIKSLNQ